MKNNAVEFHDSTLGSIERGGPAIVLHLAPAIVHTLDGDPGVDAGEVWLQSVDLVMAGSASDSTCGTYHLWIAEGSIRTSAGFYSNLFPLPMTAEGPILIRLLLANAEELKIEGEHLEVSPVGEARFLEYFDP